MTKRIKAQIEAAAKARSDLIVFYAVIALLEGGTISADSDRDVQRIISICKHAAGKSLARMDRAVADVVNSASHSTEGKEP